MLRGARRASARTEGVRGVRSFVGRGRLYLGGFLIPLLSVLAIAVVAPSSALAATGSITGTVRDSNTGQPVAGITVQAEETTQANVVATSTAPTDANGNYTIAGLNPATDYVVEFNPAGAANNADYSNQFYNDQTSFTAANTAGNQVTVTSGGTTSNINANLDNIPGTISGTVTDSSTNPQAPLSGIEVDVTNNQGNNIGTTFTAANGTYTLSVPSATTADTVRINNFGGNDFSTSTQSTTVTGGQTSSVNAALTPLSGHVTGTVTAGGVGVAGVTVQAYDTNGNPLFGQTTQTAADGTYTLTGLGTHAYEIRFNPASNQNYVPQYYNGKSGYANADSVAVTNQVTTQNINASLSAGGTITGTVTNGSTGAPVPGANVSVIGCSDSNNCATSTAANGTYTLTGLPAGTYYLQISAGGNYLFPQYFNGEGPQGSPDPVAVAVGQTATANDAMLTGGTISGTVTSAAGGPVAGEGVSILDSSGNTVTGTTTAPDGSYTVAGLNTGTYKVLFSGSQDYVAEFYGGASSSATAPGVSVTRGSTTGGINAALPPASSGGRIAGVVTGPNGPLQGDFVTVYDSAGHRIDAAGTSTDQDGSYKTDPLLPGTYKVKFSAAGNLGFQYYNAQVTLAAANGVGVSAGATTPSINAALVPAGSISGTVTDATTHAGLNNISVQLLDASGNVLTGTSTAPDGTYTITNVPAGTAYHVEFNPAGVNINSGDGVLYAPQFYNNKLTLASSDPVAVAGTAKTANINAALGAASGVALPTTAPVVTPKPPVAGKPKASGASLSGLAKRKATLKFKLAAGTNGAPKLKSFKVEVPKGLAFIKKGLKKGLKVSGGGKFTDKISKGALIVTLKGTAAKLTVAISSKALSVSKSLAKSASKHKIKSLTVTVTVTDAKKKNTTDKLVFKKPK